MTTSYLGGKRKNKRPKTQKKTRRNKRKGSKKGKSKPKHQTMKRQTFNTKPKSFSYEKQELFIQNNNMKDYFYYQRKNNEPPIFIYKDLTKNSKIYKDNTIL